MKIISSVELSKGYKHWKSIFDANEEFRQKHGIKVLAVGHEDKIWTCIEIDSMKTLMATVNTSEMIKLRE